MNEFVFPSSPNWFLSSVSSGNDAGLYAFGAKNHVNVYDVSSLNNEELQQQRSSTSSRTPAPHQEQSVDLLQGLPRMVSCYTGHERKVTSVCLSPDPEQFVCCSADESCVNLWDVLSQTTLQSHSEHKDKVTCMTWFPCDQDLVMTAGDRGSVILWRLKSNTVTTFLLLKDFVYSVQASPHSPGLVALGYRSGVVLIVNVTHDTPRVIQKLRGSEDSITAVCWCPVKRENWLKTAGNGSSEALLAAGGGREITVWNTNTGDEVFYKQLPYSGGGSRFNSQDAMGKKMWLDLKWSKLCPDYLISSSCGPQGDLYLWNLQAAKQEPELCDSSRINRHLRMIFNISLVGDKMCTFSLDRLIAVWDIKGRRGLVSFCAIGGFAYSIRASPVDPGMLAIGAGDNVIRVWNQSNKSRHLDVTSFSYGARSMITSVAWHPEREGILAYGTDNGRVGILNTFTVKPPLMSFSTHTRTVYVVCWGPPLQASPDKNRQYQVYSVGDGIILQHFFEDQVSKRKAVNLSDLIREASGTEKDNTMHSELTWKADYTALAIGSENGSIHVYSFPGLKRLYAVAVHQRIINCIRWHPETTAESVHSSPCRSWLAFGGNDKFISIVDLPSVFVGSETGSAVTVTKTVRQLEGHLTKTTDLCWSPHHDGRLVSAGYDRLVIVWNVKTGEGLASFSGHHDRVLTVRWSYLDPDLIISGGCDSTVRVWRVSAQSWSAVDVKERRKKKKKFFKPARANGEEVQDEITATEHEVTELQDLLMAKRQQLMLQMQSSVESTQMPTDDSPQNETQSSAKNATEGPQTSLNDPPNQLPHKATATTPATPATDAVLSSPPSSCGSGITANGVKTAAAAVEKSDVVPQPGPAATQDPSTLAHLLPPSVSATRISLPEGAVAGEVNGHIPDDDTERPGCKIALGAPARAPFASKSEADHTTTARAAALPQASPATDNGDKLKKKKLKAKAILPVTSSAINCSKTALQQDILDLCKVITGQGSPDIVDSKPHLGLFTSRLGAHRCLVQESEHHLNHGNMEYHLQLELWRGNVAGAIQIARQKNQLSDWIVSMAPLASHDLWEVVSCEYAEQLEEDGQYHKAVTYLLAAHKVHQAIDLFRRHKLFKEAVSLARIRLSPVDPILEDLYTEWGQNLMKDGHYEMAAKCYLAMRHIQEAEKALSKRHDQSSLRTACYMTLLVSDVQQSLVYAYKLFSQYLVMGQWQEAGKFSMENPSFQILQPILLTHELLVQHLATLCPLMTFTQKQMSPEMLSQWPQKDSSGSITQLPEYLLDQSDMDSTVPWQPFVIGKRTFPHHLLQVWHQRLDITMVTQQLKAMHAAICQLAATRQSLADLPALLLQVSVDVTLCLLALLTSETSPAIVHLLQAVSTLHQAGHTVVQEALCRLMLPQGPKYILKLQQEFNASRVLIAMDRHGDLEVTGADQQNSVRKYLAEIKDDDDAISMPGARCRELDSLRAYYYLAVLDHFKNSILSGRNENDSIDGMPSGEAPTDIQTAAGGGHQKCPGNQGFSIESRFEPVSGGDASKVESEYVCDMDQNGQLGHTSGGLTPDHNLLGRGDSGQVLSASSQSHDCGHAQVSSDRTHLLQDINAGGQISLSLSPELSRLSSLSPQLPKVSETKSADMSPESSSVDPLPVPSHQPLLTPAAAGSLSTGRTSGLALPATSVGESPRPTSQEHVATAYLNYSTLLRLSKGILWDVQAKREALTETLGYIHQAISQHLLLHRSPGDQLSEPTSTDLSHSVSSSSNNNSIGSHPQQAVTLDHVEDGGCSRTRLVADSPTQEPGLASDGRHRHSTPSLQTVSASSPSLECDTFMTPRFPVCAEPAPKHGLVRSMSETYGTFERVEQELLGPLKSESEDFQKPRKILWLDSQGSGTNTTQAANSSSSTFQICRLTPDGKPIPLEWDGLPVDIKYSMKYVTLSLLRQEQDVIAQELRKVPDASKIPFPATLPSVEKLMNASLRSCSLTPSEKRKYHKQLKDWASVFAVTSYQQKHLEALITADC